MCTTVYPKASRTDKMARLNGVIKAGAYPLSGNQIAGAMIAQCVDQRVSLEEFLRDKPCHAHIWGVLSADCPDCIYLRGNRVEESEMIDLSHAPHALDAACLRLTDDEARHVRWIAKRENYWAALKMARLYFTQRFEVAVEQAVAA